MPSDAEILSNFRDFMARQNPTGAATFEPGKNHPLHRGVVDASYVRPAASEFPKMVYKKSATARDGFITRVVKTVEEEAQLAKGWLTTAEEIHRLLNPIYASQYADPDDATAPEDEKPEKKASKKAA
jgi:hypothetical protein